MYAIIDDLKQRMKDTYNELYLDGEVVNDALATDDLIATNSEIDGALACRYPVPIIVVEVLPLLRSWALTLTEELAWCRGDAVDVPEAIEKRCKNVRRLLDLYAKGERKLAGVVEKLDSGNTAIISGPDPICTRENLEGY